MIYPIKGFRRPSPLLHNRLLLCGPYYLPLRDQNSYGMGKQPRGPKDIPFLENLFQLSMMP